MRAALPNAYSDLKTEAPSSDEDIHSPLPAKLILVKPPHEKPLESPNVLGMRLLVRERGGHNRLSDDKRALAADKIKACDGNIKKAWRELRAEGHQISYGFVWNLGDELNLKKPYVPAKGPKNKEKHAKMIAALKKCNRNLYQARAMLAANNINTTRETLRKIAREEKIPGRGIRGKSKNKRGVINATLIGFTY